MTKLPKPEVIPVLMILTRGFMFLFSRHNLFHYTQSVNGESNLVVDIELPGVDPSTVKLSYRKDEIVLNGEAVARVTSDRYDLSAAKAELKYGLLKIKVPEVAQGKGEIPLDIA